MEQAEARSFLVSLRQEHQLYRSMIEIDRRQSELLQSEKLEDPDALLELVRDKQNLMQQVSTIEATLEPLRQRWHADREHIDPELAEPIDAELGALAETIRELIDLEDQAHQRLQVMRGVALEDIETIRKKSQINKAYSAYGSKRQGPKFIDQRTKE